MMQRFYQLASLCWLLTMVQVSAAETNTVTLKPTPTNGVANAKPASTNAEANVKLDMNYFRMVSERNIFNPNRRPRVSNNAAPPRPVQVDVFTLLGTGSYETQSNAFFDGTSFQFRKTVGLGESIANYKIVGITSDSVTLGASSNQTITLSIGMQMKRSDGGPWSLVAGSQIPAASVSTPATSDQTTTNSTSTTTSSSSAADDVIKRMMERRAKEK